MAFFFAQVSLESKMESCCAVGISDKDQILIFFNEAHCMSEWGGGGGGGGGGGRGEKFFFFYLYCSQRTLWGKYTYARLYREFIFYILLTEIFHKCTYNSFLKIGSCKKFSQLNSTIRCIVATVAVGRR